MASNQKSHVQKAESAAAKAADELSQLNKTNRDYEQECAKMDFPPTPYDYHHQQSSGSGVFSSMMKSVHDTFEHTKDVLAGKSHQAVEMGSEYKDYVAEKGIQAKDSTMEKVGEYKDYAVEKAKEEKEISSVKMSELKDSATDVARRAMDFLTGRKQEMIEEEKMDDETKDKYTLTEDEARKKMQQLKLEEEGYEDEEKKRAKADKETAADRGIAGRSNIYSAMWSARDMIRDKITQPTDIVNETRAASQLGGTKRIAGAKRVNGDETDEGVKMVSVDNTPAGAGTTPSKMVD